jgi:hypothetical protein
MAKTAYFSPSLTAFQIDRGRFFGVLTQVSSIRQSHYVFFPNESMLGITRMTLRKSMMLHQQHTNPLP